MEFLVYIGNNKQPYLMRENDFFKFFKELNPKKSEINYSCFVDPGCNPPQLIMNVKIPENLCSNLDLLDFISV